MMMTPQFKTFHSEEERKPYVVSSSWLRENLENPSVIVIDCRFSLADPDLGRHQYETSHIPGASFLDLNQDLSSPVQPHGGRHPLPDPLQLSQKLADLGVNSTDTENPTLIVAYDDSRLAFSARLWWLLQYMGHDNVVVLDGGYAGWQRDGYPVTNEIPLRKAGRFVPRLRSDWVVDIDMVKARQNLPGTVLVDSRESDRYRGEREPIDPIAGHIPGAVNYPWQEITNSQGYIRALPDQQQRWTNLSQAEEIIVYCGSGVTACVNLLSLAMVGVSNGKLYAGSWSDWCSYL